MKVLKCLKNPFVTLTSIILHLPKTGPIIDAMLDQSQIGPIIIIVIMETKPTVDPDFFLNQVYKINILYI